jgi:NAD(P)-dependent dehydrogenase (short-subunit alcohol dehydrogenase family)
VTSLEGRVVVVVAGDASAREAAQACAAAGAAVALVAADEHEALAGEIARDVVLAGGRVSVFVGSLTSADDRDALAEMLAELY